MQNQSWLSWFYRGAIFLIFIILFSKLFEIQIIKGSYYRSLAEENRIRHVNIPAPRGKILARGGQELKGSEFAHITGYLARVSDEEVNKIDPNCPEKGIRKSEELVGRTGLSSRYNCKLKGYDGEILEETDTNGSKLRELARKKEIPGNDLVTTIDFELQIEAAKQMDGKKGAVIATDTNGEILAFYSSPSFDPANLTPSLKNPDLPFFNRVIGGLFHPGSVFKPLVVLAALESDSIQMDYVYDDKGIIEVNGFSYTNWYFTQYGRVEGVVDAKKALARSTDTYFYKVGEITGPDTMGSWASKFGLDKKTGVDIDGEVEGLIPTPEWKKRVKKEAWFLGNTYHLSIGQGDLAVTPIEINKYITGIAGNGKFCNPHFLVETKSNCEEIEIADENLMIVKEGMKAVCTEGGTGFTFFDFSKKYNTDIACKTGTAEVEVDGTPHAWFTLFSPIEKPEIVLTVLVEKGGEGSKVAGPIARSIMDKWQLIQNP